MREFSKHNDGQNESIQHLLQRYNDFKHGYIEAYFEEEDFERIIEYYEIEENFTDALQAIEIAVEQFPYSSALLSKKADLLLNNRRFDTALELLDKAAIFDNRNPDIYILKTEALLALEREIEAEELLDTALGLFEGDEKIDLLFELADVYDDYEEFDKVFDCMKLILQLDPLNEEALYKICFWTDYTGRNAECIELHLNIINDHPYSELAWFNLGAAYQGIKLYEKAIDAYNYSIAINEKFDYAYRNIGDAHIRLRNYKEAIESLEKVLELSKPEDVIYEAIGYCYERLKNYVQARSFYRKAIHLNEERSVLLYKIAFTYYRQEKYQSCIQQIEAAIKIKNNKPEYYLLLAEAKLAIGLYKEAAEQCARVIKLRPRSISGWETLLTCLYKADMHEQGLAQIDVAMHMTGFKKPVLYYYKALFCFALMKNKEALRWLEEGLNMAPKQVKRILDVDPQILQHQKVADLIVKYKCVHQNKQRRNKK